jgi:hypothetical protein
MPKPELHVAAPSTPVAAPGCNFFRKYLLTSSSFLVGAEGNRARSFFKKAVDGGGKSAGRPRIIRIAWMRIYKRKRRSLQTCFTLQCGRCRDRGNEDGTSRFRERPLATTRKLGYPDLYHHLSAHAAVLKPPFRRLCLCTVRQIAKRQSGLCSNRAKSTTFHPRNFVFARATLSQPYCWT